MAEGLWIKDRQSKFKDFTMLPPHLIQIILVVLCRKSCYFEDILKLWIFRLRTFCYFFQVCVLRAHPAVVHRMSLPGPLLVSQRAKQQAWIVERMGRYHKILEPGLNLLVPIWTEWNMCRVWKRLLSVLLRSQQSPWITWPSTSIASSTSASWSRTMLAMVLRIQNLQ